VKEANRLHRFVREAMLLGLLVVGNQLNLTDGAAVAIYYRRGPGFGWRGL